MVSSTGTTAEMPSYEHPLLHSNVVLHHARATPHPVRRLRVRVSEEELVGWLLQIEFIEFATVTTSSPTSEEQFCICWLSLGCRISWYSNIHIA